MEVQVQLSSVPLQDDFWRPFLKVEILEDESHCLKKNLQEDPSNMSDCDVGKKETHFMFNQADFMF